MRRTRYSNVRTACTDFQRLTGHRIHYSAWAAYEAGSRPIGDQHMAWLEQFFGPMPAEVGPSGDNSDVVAAIRELVEAVDRQSAALAERDATLLALVEGLGRAIATQRDGNGRAVPDGVGQ